MKKNVVIGIVVLVIILVVGVFVAQKKTEVPVVTPVATSSSTTTEPIMDATNTITVDWTKLEKDTIYTEEEGKYENLPPDGKKLLEELVGTPQCIQNPSGMYCDEALWEVQNSSLISLHNNLLLLDTGGVKGNRYHEFYDLARNQIISQPIPHHPCARNNDLIICVTEKSPNEQELIYYRFGMSEFVPIPMSILYKDDSYLYHIGMGFMDIKWKIDGDNLKITVFRKQPEVVSNPWPVIRDVTFDLSTLP